MFYVYSGYVDADTDFDYPSYGIEMFHTEDEVIQCRLEFEESLDDNDEASGSVFRVFQGKEVFLRPKEVITSYKLSSK